jgi:cyclopropane fatty-acyl-phospholipid synthase-like methyltransferase
MSSAGQAAKRGMASTDKIPLRLRLKAWWEGYELDDLLDDGGRPRGRAGAGPAAGKADSFEPFAPWSETHLEVMQAVWGEGMVGPGDPDYIRHLVKPLGLNPAMTILEAGCGMGGAARVMSESFGVWVSAMDPRPELVKAGMRRSEAAGLAKKAQLSTFDPEVCEPKARTYDCIVSLGFLYRVRNKTRLLEQFDTALKAKGQILIVDYVLAKPGQEPEELTAWTEGEPWEVSPWSVAQYTRALTERGLEVRITEDITDTVRQQIVNCWADHMAAVGQEAGDPRTADTLVNEVELWTRRVQALQSGALGICRLYARKKGSNLLSDW